MAEHPVTHQEMKDEVGAAEARGVDLVDRVTDHFDQRMKDTERVLTWRMVAVGGMTGAVTALLDVVARGGDSATVKAAIVVANTFS